MPSKRYKQALEAERWETVSLKDAIDALGKFPRAKFDESVDLSLRLGVDQTLRPNGARHCGVAQRQRQDCARGGLRARRPRSRCGQEAGADHVGLKELLQRLRAAGRILM